MPSLEYDLRFLEQGLDALESYLLSDRLYESIGISPPAGESPYPSLTIGNVLLAIKRLEAIKLPINDESRYMKIRMRIDSLRLRWGVAWERKVLREFEARLRQWCNFIEEYLGRPSSHFDRYKYEIRQRVILDLLQAETNAIRVSDIDILAERDKTLQSLLCSTPFIWDANLSVLFTPEHFWYLYGILPVEKTLNDERFFY